MQEMSLCRSAVSYGWLSFIVFVLSKIERYTDSSSYELTIKVLCTALTII